MAVYSGNADHLTIDGTNMHDYLVDIEIAPSMETADVSGGQSTTHRERNEGLNDHSLRMTVHYEITQIATILPLVANGEHTVVWGPEGNASGKPKHTQKFIITGAPTGASMMKDSARVFTVTGIASAEPTDDMWNGATF